MGEAALAGLQAQLVHERLELLPVLAPLDRLGLGADEAHAVGLQQAGLVSLEDLLQHLQGEGLDVGGVRPLRVGHDARRVAVQQHRADALLPQRLQRLRPRIVELAGLPDLDRTAAQHQHGVDVRSFGHG